MALYDGLDAKTQSVVRKLWQADAQGGAAAERWRRFWQSLTSNEKDTLLADWLRTVQPQLDWEEHVAGFLSAVLGIRNRPWFPGEYTAEYAAASAAEWEAVSRRLVEAE
jgi:hypothetical protein